MVVSSTDRGGKRLAFLSGSPTTNRFDVAVGRKISLLLRLPPLGTRDRSLHAARQISVTSICTDRERKREREGGGEGRSYHGSNLIERVPVFRCIYRLNELIPAQFTGY